MKCKFECYVIILYFLGKLLELYFDVTFQVSIWGEIYSYRERYTESVISLMITYIYLFIVLMRLSYCMLFFILRIKVN